MEARHCTKLKLFILAINELNVSIMKSLEKPRISKKKDINIRAKYKARIADAASALISGFLMSSQDDLLH